MARTGSGTLLSRRNHKLDSFLKRNTERAVYERIRAYEPCVVVSDTFHKVYMHAVLSDEHVYLTEYPPRTLTAAVSFGRVRDIELVKDFPDFLSGKDRERCQHIRIIHTAERSAGKARDWWRRDRGEGLPPVVLLSHPTVMQTGEGYPAESQWGTEELCPLVKPTRSASCPNSETLGLLWVPQPPSLSSSPSSPPSPSEESLTQVSRRFSSVLSRLLRRDGVTGEEERDTELHLYVVSETSRLYLHLQSCWNSFIIRSTLLQDPLYRRRCSATPDSSAISGERTAHLFGQLSSELLQDGISVESLYMLLQELRTAALRYVTLRRLFWRSSELCDFLVQTLEDCLHGCVGLGGVYTADQLLLSTLIVQTLAVMFRETEVEAARVNLLSANKGARASRMLLALVCDPHTHRSETDSELQALLAEYLDAACALLFELLILGYETRWCFSDSFLSVSWTLRVLQPHPHLVAFVSYQAQQVVLVLSGLQELVLTPVQSVLLFQRCRLLLACLQYNSHLAQHLRSHFREEFRYSVKPSCAGESLPPHYPISRPTLQLVESILSLILHR
ncbi:uncharacterized protein C12orf56 homolog [Parambassis ranga]|uniref:Uncharacterized protein C12orf56 homolog n=1 Tax=Parambassis ranga TaxID=210632 RepID=A0A6P7I7L6_9TELE|nr:uncharacterized protein C12orf56 homolog [Parambassis ranga]